MRHCAAALLLLFAAGCDRNGEPVEIVVPAGFSGPIWIVEDAQDGKPVPKEAGRYRVEVPRSGVLRVASLQPFAQWHTESARYSDGTALSCDNGEGLPADAVALRSGGGVAASSGGGRNWKYIVCYVGTVAQARKFFDEHVHPPEE